MFFVFNSLLFFCISFAVDGCFEVALQKTQSCDNQNIWVTSTMNSGFGSEFNFYLIYSLVNAVMAQKRLVFLKDGRDWNYDCPSKLSWPCYLQLPCETSMTEINQTVDFTIIERDFGVITKNISSTYEKLHWGTGSCSFSTVTQMTSIAAKYLFNLNHHTNRLIKHYISRYPEPIVSGQTRYISIQLRTTDKKYEMDPDIWVWITNMTNVANAVKPVLKSDDIKYIFIAADDCQLVKNLSLNYYSGGGSMFDDDPSLPSRYTLLSTCQVDPKEIAIEKRENAFPFSAGDSQDERLKADLAALGSVPGESPSRGNFRDTIRLLSEIHMLVRGTHFFGLITSNLVRMIFRLRTEDQQSPSTTHLFAEHLTQRDINTRREHLTS